MFTLADFLLEVTLHRKGRRWKEKGRSREGEGKEMEGKGKE